MNKEYKVELTKEQIKKLLGVVIFHIDFEYVKPNTHHQSVDKLHAIFWRLKRALGEKFEP